MSHLNVGNRVYIKSEDDFAYKQRTMLGIKDSAVLIPDTNETKRVGYIGFEALHELVDPTTKKNAFDEPVEVPLDFRVIGISVLDNFGISKDTQGLMFNNFIKNYTKEQRKTFIDQFASIDTSNTELVQQFVNNMISMLT
jgi:hypothetical protein